MLGVLSFAHVALQMWFVCDIQWYKYAYFIHRCSCDVIVAIVPVARSLMMTLTVK